MIHTMPSPLAGKRMMVMGKTILFGDELVEVVDWFDRVKHRQWQDNPNKEIDQSAYRVRVLLGNLPMDGEVVIARFVQTGDTVLFHVSELVEVDPEFTIDGQWGVFLAYNKEHISGLSDKELAGRKEQFISVLGQFTDLMNKIVRMKDGEGRPRLQGFKTEIESYIKKRGAGK